jgi:hypothetical protein
MPRLTIEEAKRLALEMGAELEVAGRKFNTGGAVMQAKATAPRENPPAPVAKPTALEQRLDLLVQQLCHSNKALLAIAEAVLEGNGKAAKSLAQAAVDLAPKARPRTAYRFKIKRDGRGDASEIIATPIDP